MLDQPLQPTLFESLEARCLFAANTFYLDPGAGNGGNGSQGNPFNNWADVVNDSRWGDDDTVLFKRGTTLREQVTLQRPDTSEPDGFTSVDNITLSAYGSGDKPIISGARIVSGWSPVSGQANVYSKSVGGNAYTLIADRRHVVYAGTDAPGDPGFSLDFDEFTFKPNTGGGSGGTLYWKVAGGDPDTQGIVTEAGGRTNGIRANSSSNVTVRDLRVEGSNSSGILVNDDGNPGKPENWLIDDVEVFFTNSVQSGGAGIHMNLAPNSTVRNSRIAFVSGEGIFAGKAPGYTIENNIITDIFVGVNEGPDGIQVATSNGDTPGGRGIPAENLKVKDFVIRGNYIDKTVDGRLEKGGIQSEFGDGGLIEYNFIRGGRFGIGFQSDDSVVRYNIITETGDLGALRSAEDQNFDNIRVHNNLIYDVNGVGLFITNEAGFTDRERTNLRVYNNTFFNVSEGVRSTITRLESGEFKNNLLWDSNPESVYDLRDVNGAQWFSNYNLFGNAANANGPGETFIRLNSQTFTTLDDYQNTINKDRQSIGSAPSLQNPGNENFQPNSGSPVVGAGTFIGPYNVDGIEDEREDLFGFPLPGGSPNIGAIQSPAGQRPYLNATRSATDWVQFEFFDERSNGANGNNITHKDNANRLGLTSFRPLERVDVVSKTKAANDKAVGYTAAGEWLEYTVDLPDTEQAVYDLEVDYVTSDNINQTPGEVRVTVNGRLVSVLDKLEPGIGYNSNFQTYTERVVVPEGGNDLVVRFELSDGFIDLDQFRFVPVSNGGVADLAAGGTGGVMALSAAAPTTPALTTPGRIQAEAFAGLAGSVWQAEGSYVWAPPGSGDYYSGAPTADSAIISTTLTNVVGGTYDLRARVNSSDPAEWGGADDSFYLRVNDGAWTYINVDGRFQKDWYTRTFNDQVTLVDGTNTIEIAVREDGTKIDWIELV
ncbi:MAG: right-handed parallel beta-helix repeat-containing protein [Planctomycetota bacterium]